MPTQINLNGQTFGRVTAIGLAPRQGKDTAWLMKCSCGTYFIARTKNLRSGTTLSCGCLKREKLADLGRTHGMAKTPTYESFSHARSRCNNPNGGDFHHYGGRGIEFRFNSFEEFFSEVGERPGLEYTIDRKDTNGHYERGNVRWATWTEQANNRRNCKNGKYA